MSDKKTDRESQQIVDAIVKQISHELEQELEDLLVYGVSVKRIDPKTNKLSRVGYPEILEYL